MIIGSEKLDAFCRAIDNFLDDERDGDEKARDLVCRVVTTTRSYPERETDYAFRFRDIHKIKRKYRSFCAQCAVLRFKRDCVLCRHRAVIG